MATDPVVTIFIAYKAYMAEHTGLSWSDLERILQTERDFWRSRPDAAALVREHLDWE